MAGVLVPIANSIQYFTNQGAVLAGGKIQTLVAGTSTPLATYTTSALSVANANPIILDSSGRLTSEVWVPTSTSTKIIIKTSADITLATWDNIPGLNDIASSSVFWAGSAGGSANAITLTVSGVTALVAGQTYIFIGAASNTGTTTINVNSLGAVAATRAGTKPLRAGDIPINATVVAQYDGTQFQIVGAHRQGHLIKRTVHTTSATFTTDTAARGLVILAVGAGGGGGGTNATGAAGGGGGGGGFCMAVQGVGPQLAAAITATYTTTIGAAGTAGSTAGGNGGNGGDTIVQDSGSATILTAGGGVGGTGSTANTTHAAGGAGGTADTAASGSLIIQSRRGGRGVAGLAGATAALAAGGHGGDSMFGVGGTGSVAAAAAGTAADASTGNLGGGGGGGGVGAAAAGGAGRAGAVIFLEYA